MVITPIPKPKKTPVGAAACARLRPAMATTAAFFEQPILNSPYEYPSRHWELDAGGQPTNRILPERRKVAFITPIPKPKKQKGIRQESILFDAAAQALGTEGQQYDLTAFIGGVRHQVDRWRERPDSNAWGVTPETRAAPDALAQPSVRRHPAVLLPGRGGGDRDLADRGGADPRQGRPAVSRSDRRRQRRGQSGPRAAGAEARHRGREDHRHGDDHRLADDQRGAPAGQPAVHARLPGGDPRRDDPGPAAGAPAERSGQLLREPRAGAERHAARPGAGEDRRHQLPRVPAARDAAAVEGRPRPAAGAGTRAADKGDRGADAAARHAGPDGHEAHPGPERRGAPLLPRGAGRGGRRKGR